MSTTFEAHTRTDTHDTQQTPPNIPETELPGDGPQPASTDPDSDNTQAERKDVLEAGPTDKDSGPDDDESDSDESESGPSALARFFTNQWHHLRTGSQQLYTERAAWLTAHNLGDDYLRAHLLNHRYGKWKAGQEGEMERLQEKAEDLEKQANSVFTRSQSDDIEAGAYKQARKQAGTAQEQAVQWRQAAQDIELQSYTGHREPTADELANHRKRLAGGRRWRMAALGLAAGWAEIRIGGLLPALTATGITATAWAKGRFPGWHSGSPDVPPLAYEATTGKRAADRAAAPAAGATGAAAADQQAAASAGLFPADTGRPFPIHDVTDAQTATECMRRALLAEGVPVADIGEAAAHPWGWETVARVSEGTPGAIADRLSDLETRFDVGDGDVILQPNRKRTAEAVLRVLTGDLFGAMKPPPPRPPHSVDITTAGVFGMSADGSDLAFSIAELMGEVIARSGGGKSTILRALLDWTTAASNAVTVFLDPSGDGPGQFKDAVRLNATNPLDIEFILLSLYRLATGRARIRRKLGMGDTWTCTPDHPAIIVFVDEFPKLTKRSKQIIAELLLVGRKEGVWLLFAAQGATKELLGSNIAEQPALKILGACRSVDTTAALGGGAGEDGYLPHRLRPKSGQELNHCAQTYIVGAPGLSEDPMLHKWHYIPDAEGGRRAAERLAAGLLDADQASIDAALNAPNPPNLKFADEDEYLHYIPWPKLLDMVAEPWEEEPVPVDTGDDLPAVLQEIRVAFSQAGDPEFLLTDQVLKHLATTGPQWQAWDDREPEDRRREAMKKVARELRKAGVEDLKTARRKDLDKDNPPSGYWRKDVEAAIESLPD